MAEGLTVPKLIGWESLDKILFSEETEELARIIATAREVCPKLRVAGDHFYICGSRLPEETKGELSKYQVHDAHVILEVVKSRCMGDYEKCGFYNGSFKRD